MNDDDKVKFPPKISIRSSPRIVVADIPTQSWGSGPGQFIYPAPPAPLEDNPFEMLLDLLHNKMPAPKPISKVEEHLYRMAEERGFCIRHDPDFGLDVQSKTLFIALGSDKQPGLRLASLAHEIGHLIRFDKGLTTAETVKMWRIHLSLHGRSVLTEEIMAWRTGLRALREAGGALPPRPLRHYRRQCLATYRASTKCYGRAVRKL